MKDLKHLSAETSAEPVFSWPEKVRIVKEYAGLLITFLLEAVIFSLFCLIYTTPPPPIQTTSTQKVSQ